MGYREDLDKFVKLKKKNDLKKHTIVTKHSNGLYRHYRCQPGSGTFYQFDIITWMGYLAFVGDCGHYMFSCEKDMIDWASISWTSPSYMASKCVSSPNGIKEFRTELYIEHLDLKLSEQPEEAETIQELRNLVDSDFYGPDELLRKMYRSGLWFDVPLCKSMTFDFLWCLECIGWFCNELKKQNKVEKV